MGQKKRAKSKQELLDKDPELARLAQIYFERKRAAGKSGKAHRKKMANAARGATTDVNPKPKKKQAPENSEKRVRRQLEEALSQGGRLEASNLARFYEGKQEWTQAAYIYERLGIHSRLGFCYQSLERWAEAGKAFEKAEKWSAAAYNYERAGLELAAAASFEKARHWSKAARCYHRLQKWQRAAENYERADNPEMAHFCFQKIPPADRREQAPAMKATDKPKDPNAMTPMELMVLAEAHESRGQFLMAGTIWYQLGRMERAGHAFRRGGNLKTAVVSYVRAGAWYHAGDTLRQQGDFAGAGAHFRKAKAWEMAAACFVQGSRFIEAARAFEAAGQWGRAAEYFERGRDGVNAGRCLERKGDFEAAAVSYEGAGAFERAANCYGEVGLIQQANRCMKKHREVLMSRETVKTAINQSVHAKNVIPIGCHSDRSDMSKPEGVSFLDPRFGLE